MLTRQFKYICQTLTRNISSKKRARPLKNAPLDLTYVDSAEPSLSDEVSLYITEENQHDSLKEVLTPLANLPYKEQLEYKSAKMESVMKRVQKEMFNVNGKMVNGKGLMPCPLDFVLPSPVTEHYRHKDKFSLGYGLKGKNIVAGMFIGRQKQGVVCIRPRDVRNMKPSHSKIAELYENFIPSSKFSVCLKFNEGGNWRGIAIRSNENGDHMAVVTFHPQELDGASVALAKKELKEYFQTGPGKEANLASLYFQQCRHTKCSREQAPFELLSGEPYIYENLSGRKFRISPDSIFAMNRAVAEVLYEKVAELAGVSHATTVLDICCGIGTMGLLLANKVEQVIGIDAISSAIDDARVNAKLNGIENVDFRCGKSEKILSSICKEVSKSGSRDVVAVINPGKSGVIKSVIAELRQATSIRRLVYVSCDPSGNAMNNFVQLCTRERKEKGSPFTPRCAVPVDTFPHADHCELVILFER